MSMLSAQAAELRELAGDGSMEWVAGPIRAATLLNAADIILSLRDRAQELQAENDKLREDNACLVKAIEELHSVKLEDRLVALENESDRLREQLQEAEHEESVAWDRVRKAERESDRLRAARDAWQENDAKLRELVRALIYATHPADRATLIEQAAELGIEVNA